MQSMIKPAGNLSYVVIRHDDVRKAPLSWKLRNVLRGEYLRGWLAFRLAHPIGRLFGFGTITSRLSVKVLRKAGYIEDYGVVSYRVVTTAFCNALVTGMHTQASIGNLYYHAVGSGSAASAVSDTGLQSEFTTQYNPDGTRPAGTHVAATGSANVYESVATITVDATCTIREHGVMSAGSGAATLIDRHTVAEINLASGDSYIPTYQIIFYAGG